MPFFSVVLEVPQSLQVPSCNWVQLQLGLQGSSSSMVAIGLMARAAVSLTCSQSPTYHCGLSAEALWLVCLFLNYFWFNLVYQMGLTNNIFMLWEMIILLLSDQRNHAKISFYVLYICTHTHLNIKLVLNLCVYKYICVSFELSVIIHWSIWLHINYVY